MSEAHTHDCLEEKMAIPEGGSEERMDVSECLDDTGNDGSGYVSVNSKGPGRPIHIRSGDKITEELSQIEEEARAAAALPDVLNIPIRQVEIEESVEELQNKKTGNIQTLGSSTPDTYYPENINQADHQCHCIPPKTVAQKKDVENHYTSIDNEETNVHSDLEFQSQAKVVSIGNGLTSYITDSPRKQKYKAVQEQARKKLGTKKSGQRKECTSLRLVNRERPYPNWMNTRLSEIENGCIDIEGKKHRLLISLVPVDDVADTQWGQLHDGIAEHDNEPDKEQTVLDGSIYRPPESSLGIERECESSKVTYRNAIYQQPCSSFGYKYGDSYDDPGDSIAPVAERSISDIGENTVDQPLDLTVEKPLDLSMGGNMRLSSTGMNESNSLAAPYDVASMSTDVRAESNVGNDQYREKAISSIESHSQDIVADEAQDLSLLSCSNANQYEAVSNDGNLPSLSTLTLESSDQQYTVTVAVQDSAVGQVLQSSSGQQYILGLLQNGQLKLYYSNQKKAAVNQLSTSTPAYRIPAVERPLQENVLARSCKDPVIPSNRMTEPEQVIPIPAMPDLQRLELANKEGCIMESKEEQVKKRLKEKLLQNRMS